MVKHCYSVVNSGGQSLGTHWYHCCYGSGYNSQASGFGQSTVVSLALGQELKAGGLALTLHHLPCTQCDSRPTQFSWSPPPGTLPGLPTLGSISTQSFLPVPYSKSYPFHASYCREQLSIWKETGFGVRCSHTQIRARLPAKL